MFGNGISDPQSWREETEIERLTRELAKANAEIKRLRRELESNHPYGQQRVIGLFG